MTSKATSAPLAEHVSGRIRPALLVLACAVGVVMLIVCANLSNLLLARTATRQKEIAIRTALGAGQRRLIRQMLTESVVLSCCGAALGLVLAVVGTRALAHLQRRQHSASQQCAHVDATALAFTLMMAVLTGLHLRPRARASGPAGALHDALKDTARGSTEGKARSWIRGALVVSEIAFACVLLVGAGLLIRSFLRGARRQSGFPAGARSRAARRSRPRSIRPSPRQNAYFDECCGAPGTFRASRRPG